MKAFIFIIVFNLLFYKVFTQLKTYKWEFELCNYSSSYNSKLQSKTEIDNCIDLGLKDDFTITSTPFIFKIDDIKLISADLQKLEIEFKTKNKKLKELVLPKTQFWNNLRALKLKEQLDVYELSKITYLAFSDSSILNNKITKSNCLNKYKNALLAGGDSLLKTWFLLKKERAASNANPEEVMKEYETQLASDDKFNYAKIDIITFGWWNCGNNFIRYANSKISRDLLQKAILKLFFKTKKLGCDEP